MKADIKSPKHLAQHKNSKAAEDLPGLGHFYCIECAKYFSDSHNLNEHRRGKVHKRRYLNSEQLLRPSLTTGRVKDLKQEAHSQQLAEAAVGLTAEQAPRD